MKKLARSNNRIIILLFSLLSVSLACSFPDVFKAGVESALERCYVVDREEYERVAVQLGRTPKTPEYPDGAVYEVCYMDRDPTSVRMSEGYRPEENVPVNTGAIPVGTYTGESDLHLTPSSAYLPPDCTENSVTVVIGKDGTAGGEFRSICSALEEKDYGENRMTYHSHLTGVIRGELLDVSGQLKIAFTWHSYGTMPKLDSTITDTTTDFEILYNVTVSNGAMSFTPAEDADPYYSFVLHK